MVSKFGQATIEYVVILAVIVVIGLVVVSLLSGFTTGTQGVSNAPGQITGVTGGVISIVEAAGDYTGDALLKLQVPGQPVTLTRIATSDGSAVSYYNNQISARGSVVSFSGLNNSASNPCPQGFIGVRNTTLIFTYNTLKGQEYSQPTSVQMRCVPSSTSTAVEDVIGLGSGTLEKPWIVNSCKKLQNVKNHLDGNYVLIADINCSDTSTWNSGTGFVPIGVSGTCASGGCTDETTCEQTGCDATWGVCQGSGSCESETPNCQWGTDIGCETYQFLYTSFCDGSYYCGDYSSQEECEGDSQCYWYEEYHWGCRGSYDCGLLNGDNVSCNQHSPQCSFNEACTDSSCLDESSCTRQGCNSSWTDGSPFTGTLDGKGYTVSDIYLNRSLADTWYGSSTGTIQNLNVTYAN